MTIFFGILTKILSDQTFPHIFYNRPKILMNYFPDQNFFPNALWKLISIVDICVGVSGFIVGVGGLIVRVCFFLFTFDDVLDDN